MLRLPGIRFVITSTNCIYLCNSHWKNVIKIGKWIYVYLYSDVMLLKLYKCDIFKQWKKNILSLIVNMEVVMKNRLR